MDATARPYVEKITGTTRPYTDAAAAKAKELIDKVEVRFALSFSCPAGPLWFHRDKLSRGERS